MRIRTIILVTMKAVVLKIIRRRRGRLLALQAGSSYMNGLRMFAVAAPASLAGIPAFSLEVKVPKHEVYSPNHNYNYSKFGFPHYSPGVGSEDG